MEDLSNSAYELGQALGRTVVLFWVFVIGVALLLLALLIWFIWTMIRIERACTRISERMSDISKQLSDNEVENWTSRRLSDISRRLSNNEVENRMIQGPSTSDELTKYKVLLDQGAITEEEYKLKKIQLLNK